MKDVNDKVSNAISLTQLALSDTVTRNTHLPVLDHHLGHALQSMTLELDVFMLNERHHKFLGTQTPGDRSSVRIVADEFTKIVASNGGNVVVLAGNEGDQHLDNTKVAIATLHHSCVLLKEGLRMTGTPLKVSRLNLVFVHLPAAHFLVILNKQLVENINICDTSVKQT